MHSKNCKKYQNKEENKMAKKKEQKDMAQEQEQRLNFQQKLIEILELGKKKKNMLEYQEIADFFSHAIASAPGPMWQATLKDSGCASTSKSGKASFTSTIHPSITSLSFAV